MNVALRVVEPVSVLRYSGQGDGTPYSTAERNRFDSVHTFAELKGHSVLEKECFISPIVPHGAAGSQVLIMLQNNDKPTDRVRISRTNYERLVRQYLDSGVRDQDIMKTIFSIETYLKNLPFGIH